MPYLPNRLIKLVAIAGAALATIAFAGNAANAGYYGKHYRPYVEYRDNPTSYNAYPYRYRGHGHYEIRELQRLFPSTNWPPSMRYVD